MFSFSVYISLYQLLFYILQVEQVTGWPGTCAAAFQLHLCRSLYKQMYLQAYSGKKINENEFLTFVAFFQLLKHFF